MNLLMFSGNSLRNRDWIHQARDKFADMFDGTYVQEYQHWETEEQWIDLPTELEKLEEQQLPESYGVFAKSIGMVLAVQAIDANVIKPNFLLLCGVPLGYIVKEYPEFASVLSRVDVPLIFVHNADDPVGSVQAVRDYLSPVFGDRLNLIETPGDTHEYLDFDLLREQLIKLKGSV